MHDIFTFETETLVLVDQGDAIEAFLYVVLSVVLGFVAAFFRGAYARRSDDR
jgi:fluoride exporter